RLGLFNTNARSFRRATRHALQTQQGVRCMTWRIFAIGRPKLEFARAAVNEYVLRLEKFTLLRVEFVKPVARESESDALLRRSEGVLRIALDEHGAQITSRELAEKISAWEMRGVENIALLIGGADGHNEQVGAAADWI